MIQICGAHVDDGAIGARELCAQTGVTLCFYVLTMNATISCMKNDAKSGRELSLRRQA